MIDEKVKKDNEIKQNNETKQTNDSKDIHKSLPLILYEGFFYSLVMIVIFGSIFMLLKVQDLTKPYKEKNPDYKFPEPIELLYSIPYYIIIIILFKLYKSFFMKRVYKWLDEKHSGENIEVYNEKVSIYIYKMSYLFFITIIGHFILRDLFFFPTLLGGKGNYRNLGIQGDNIFYFEKTPLFDTLYLLNLSWAFFDTYLLFTLPPQSDFPIMLLHHLATISLIAFSYLFNYSGIGCVVFYLHHSGDAFGYILRIFVYVKVHYIIKIITAIIVIILFFYTRLYVFGIIISDTYFYFEFKWGISEYLLLVFLLFLYLLHVIWLTMIIKKTLNYVIYRKSEELYKMKQR